MNAVSEGDSNVADLSSSEDSFEELKELESQLYSVVHYNDLSETIPSKIPEGYMIDMNVANECVVLSLTKDTKVPPDETDVSQNKNVTDLSDDNCLNNSEKSRVILENCNVNISKNSDESYSIKVTDTDTNVDNITKNSLVEIPSEVTAINNNHDFFNGIAVDDDDCMIINNTSSSIDSSTGNDVGKNLKSIHSDNKKGQKNSEFIMCGKNDLSATANDKVYNSAPKDSDINVSKETKERDVIINILPVQNNEIEEIVISSDEESKKEDNKHSTSTERNRSKRKKRRKMEKNCPKKWSASMIKFYCKISRKKLNFDSTKLRKKMRGMYLIELRYRFFHLF